VSIERRFKIALDETPMLMLGSQILFGFQFDGLFQNGFDALPPSARYADALALLLITLTVGLIIAPSALHRIGYTAQVPPRLLRITNVAAGISLLPFACSLSIDVYLVFRRTFGLNAGLATAGLFALLSFVCWYVVALVSAKKALRRAPWRSRQQSRSQRLWPNGWTIC
jgi:hypothetical protein